MDDGLSSNIIKNMSATTSLEEFLNGNFAMLLFALITAVVWVLYITYYNSRVIGYIVTRLLKKFYAREGYLNVGSLTVCALSGKIMFRDIVYITNDYSLRIQDGWIIFRWWLSYVPKDVSEDLSHSDTRLSVMLNGLELHVYNRCELYSKLERTFGLDPSIIPWEDLVQNEDLEAQIRETTSIQQVSIGKSWRDLIPVIKVDISSGRFVFGNRLVPTTLSINVEEAHCMYSTKPAASRLDHFMHFVKCKAENFKVILAPSPKYTGIADEPPRFMGAGFVVSSSNKIELYYYMDEPGVVPEEPEMLQLANGDIVESAPPIWGIDIKCGKGTDFSYGPWADRQREHLFKFFFPQNYQNLEVTKAPLPGEKRQVQSFDIRLSTLYESTIDILFTKNKETNAVHVNVGPGSYLEVTMPWIVNKDGYNTKVTGQLLHLEATTSLQFRSLVESETLEFAIRCHYPIRWNDHQEWLLNLTGCKATGWFIYAHKDFFEDLINDWATKSKPDLLHFIPYTWKLTVLLKEFELLTQSNEYNWVDCSSQNQENAHIAVCGDLFDFSFDLPFDNFLPPTLSLRFWIQGESVDLALYLPEVYTSRVVLMALDKNAKLLSRDGSILHPRPQDNGRKWRNVCKRSNGWIDFWSIPIAALSINYIYHPMPPYGPCPQADITTPEKEEMLLSPMRMTGRKNPILHWSRDNSQKFDPSTLTPDKVNLELEIGPSVMYLFGTALRHLVHLKESVFGEDQVFTDMNDPSNSSNTDSHASTAPAPADSHSVVSEDDLSKKEFDPRVYRPLDVVVSITMHDIQAHLMKSCMEKDPPCPIILLERFGFEMKIEYKEMQLQLLLSPAILISTDKLANRPHKDNHLNQGHMMLSGLQLRGHGMFSDRGRTLEQKTLEYAWMLEIQIGKLSGKLTSPQLFHVVTGLETLILLMCDSENELRPPRLPQECLHSKPPKQCAESDADGTYRCPSSSDVKYRMTRCSIDAIDFYLVESGTSMNLWASPVRIATCNLHGNHIKSGITTLIPAIKLRHMIAANSQVCNQHGTGTASNSNTNTTCSGKSQHRLTGSDGTDIWLEVGSVSLGPLILEAAVSLCNTDKNLHLVQHKFLKFHDEKYKKLWFLWPSDSKLLVTGRCGCIGGCVFFGRNRNGQRFFKPTRQDVQDGINIAAFKINENGKDPGFGQSILHENQLVFHTPPYNAVDVTIHDQPPPVWSEPRVCSSMSVRSKMTGSDTYILPEHTATGTNSVTDSPSTTTTGGSHVALFDGKMSLPRRFSYTSVNNRLQVTSHAMREVPYARLIDSSPTTGYPPAKLDSDSRLNTLGAGLNVPSATNDSMPKSSISDSKLAVDYFITNATPLSADAKDSESTGVGSSSITSLTVSDNKMPMSKDETHALFKRTVSLTSENHSDTFFSAEEELSHNRNSLDSNVIDNKSPTSGSCSLRNSVISSCGSYGQDGVLPSRKTFGSDFNIVPGSSKNVVNANSSGMKLSLSAHRSDHEIHTPEHRGNGYAMKNYFESSSLPEDEKSLMGSLEQLQRQLIDTPSSWPSRKSPKLKSISLDEDDTLVQTSGSALLLDSSDSHSVSSTSFISAVSSQEDLTLVNLHMQVNKPIVDSPLLISTYINHLSQVGCSNWNHVCLPAGSDIFTVPFFQRSNDGRLVFIGSRYLPRFDVLTEGFTSLKMVPRPYNESSSPLPSLGRKTENTYPWDRNQPDLAGNTNEDFEYICQEEFLSLRNESGTRTTMIIKMKGDVDIMVTPLILESLQRFVDALTPTFSVLHPVTVLNHLHMSSISKVESANILKKDKYMSQLQGGGSKRSTVERVKSVSKNTSGPLEPHSVYEEFIASQVQGTIILPKINISVLQASIVEEVISFSALDNLRDLTCVSLLAICIEDVTARFHYGKQAREVVQTFHRPTVTPSGQKKGVLSRAAGKALLLGLHFTTAPGKDNVRGEPVYIETSEKQEQEAVITFNLGKIHVQLRRLRNECSLLKDAVITAIPSYSSKVLFTTCSKASASPSNAVGDTLTVDGNSQFTCPTDELTTLSEEKMGFTMMECGFEGVSFKLVKRFKFEKEEQNTDGTKENSNEGNKNASPAPASEGQCTDSTRSKEESESTVKHGNENTNDTQGCGGAQPAGEPESSSQKDHQEGKQTSGSAHEKNEDSGNSTLNKNVDGNASSCVIEIQQVWFNFAAPPRTPITRKIDYTRLDWNLLSTASPAINAWMNPSNRFAIRVVHMLRCQYRRNTAVITCLMAEALDVPSLHVPVKSRYGRITPMAKTLQEDPSCQLCNILKKYLLLHPNVEEYLKDEVPHLSTLRQGVIVLSRQWKNILYTPLLLDHNFKSKRNVKPLNVTFAIPDPEEENAVLTDDGDGDGDGEGEADASCEECEVTDECAMLLNPATAITPNTLRKVLKTPSHKYAPMKFAEPKSENVTVTTSAERNEPAAVAAAPTAADITAALHTSSPASPGSSGGPQSNAMKPGVPPRKKKKALLPTQQPSSSRASVIFPIAPSLTTYSPQHRYPQRQDTSVSGKSNYNKKSEPTSCINPNYMLHSCGSMHSLSSGMVGDNLIPNSAASLDEHNISSPPLVSYLMSTSGSGAAGLNKPGQGEDLYTWMAKQGFEDADNKMTESKVAKSTFWDLPKEEPVVNSGQDYTLLAAGGFSLYPMHDSLRLLDAHLIFEPLLSSLGVMPQQMITSGGSGGSNGVTSLDSWGSNLTLVGGMESMRIDIVVSELGKGSFDSDTIKQTRTSKPASGKTTKLSEKPSLEIGSEIPAFLCERVNLECDVKRVADMTVVEDLSRQRRSMVYVSRGQLKKHTNTVLNVSVSARYISQQVNMPLLRLLHQISNMYQNVKHTQSELKEQEPLDLKIPPPKPPPPIVDVTRTRIAPVSQVDGKPPMYPHVIATDPKSVLSPSSSIRSARHQTFAQRLRSTSRSVKGYINLGDTPIIRSRFSSMSDDKPAQIKEEATPVASFIPKCWKTVYYLLDLYATTPETKTVAHRISTVGEVTEGYKSSKKYDTLVESKSSDDAGEKAEVASSTPVPQLKGIIREEKTRLIIFAVARIHRTRLLATLSGLKLEAEITNLHSSLTCRKKIRPMCLEYSVTGQVGRTMIVLLEGVAPNQQTVVKVTVGKSQALYSSMSRRLKDKNSALLTVGAINIDIPQHPVALHGMMTRGTKQLSSTLQELRVTRTSSRMSRGATIDEMENIVGSQPSPRQPTRTNRGSTSNRSVPPPAPAPIVQINSSPLLQPLVMHFTAVVQSLSITASLLPSLQAKYQMDQLTSNGFTGSKAKFVVDLPRHSLSFSTKVEVTEANLPSEACIELPKVHVSAEYIQDSNNPKDNQSFATDGAVLRAGNYLSAVADIGEFEQSLTTDLLNHLMFVQKVFMKEVNEVVQKVYGGEKPVPIWLEDNEESNNNTAVKRILFSLIVRVKRIQLTATTPTNCAVRLETGSVEFQISNRFQNISGASGQASEAAKIFVKTQLEVNLSLGQLIKNVLFEEADPEFQQFAFFKTRICIRNALQGEMVGEGEDKEVILITLRRPLIYIQPVAVDKAILVWLNYKNAYEYWNEQRSILNSEVLSATQQIYERIAVERLTSSSSSGILFLQLTVEDMGICVPLNPLPPTTWGLNRSFLPENDSCAAVVITLESTSISACSAGSLVSKGRFIGLCLRFADDFETSLDDWKPDINNELAGVLMNFCSVSEGTYEVCSRTTTQKSENENPKWFLNVQWQMEGVDIHLDVNIGKQLSALGHTLTMLTGVQEDEPLTACYDSDEDDDNTNNSGESLDSSRRQSVEDTLSPLACEGSMNSKKRSKELEREMYEQVKIINDLKSLGASQSTIEQEVKQLHVLETKVFRGFRRDMILKLRRQSVKGKYQLKDKFGLGTKGAYRSKSFILSSPTKEQLPKINGTTDEPAATVREHASDDSKLTKLPKVVFNEVRGIRRQISLPSENSELSLDERDQANWMSEQENKSEEMSNTEDDINSTADSSTLLDDLSSRDPIRNGNTNYPKQQEPNIDFELDVKVFINSGKCVLHTKNQVREDELKMISGRKKDRSSSGGALEFPGSPSVSRRSHREKQSGYSRLRLNPNTATPAQIAELTIFHIPGLDVKVHYESKIIPDGNLSPCYTVDSSGMITRKTNAKKASLFAWITLQSIPEETIISPHILEFLEQTLEPIPTNLRNPLQFTTSEENSNLLSNSEDDIFARYIMSGQYAYASFPVDVIVYFHMQPSTFRFSCLPVSRVECMLKLPSLDIVFSSKRADSFNDNESKSDSSSNLPIAVGGLSVTGVMADFSLYIFHPYGGKKSGLKDTQIWSPLADAERKDSLSVNVEFVKFHLSRSRKLNFETPAGKPAEQSHATIRFSTIVDIGSASFKYDMRRLTEILAFPKAWYRRSIIRRLFLGDLTRAPVFSDGEDESGPDHSEEHDLESGIDEESKMHARSGNDKSKSSTGREKVKRQESKRPHAKGRKKRGSVSDECVKPHKLAGNTPAWQTLVLFTVNFKRLNVHMNMGNVMGNVSWLTKEFHSEGRLSIGSTGHKNMFIGLGFGGSSLDAKGGIVGGTIELSKIDTFISIHEDPGTEPDHTIGLKLFALELRLDYMGTAILMSRVSSLNISLRDEWKVTTRKSSGQLLDSTKRPGMVFMHGDLNWDQLQFMISKSTAADLIKMYYKLDEFFSQQFKSSKRLFTSLQQDGTKSKNVVSVSIGSSSFRKRNPAAKKKVSSTLSDNSAHRSPILTAPETAQHHRHWQPCLQQVANLHLSTMKHALPAWGTILGGTMDLHGSNISLACFHGINFKSKSWALFSLKEPCITFATEAQEVDINEAGPSGVSPKDVHIIQTLTFSLGITFNMQSYAQQHHSMATICRVSRNVLFPPQFRTIQEWFHYAFSCSDIDAVDRFPSLERERVENVEGVRCRTPKPQETLNHTREVIFALPSMRLDLKTDHLQSATLSFLSDEKPLVDCSFITEFEDHIFVTVDAEAFFFLHDLITSYIREKERVAASQGYHRAYSPSPPETNKKRAGQGAEGGKDKTDASFEDAKEHYSKDWRNFQCRTWHLEPTVRLLSWGGKSIEPYGVDYILQKLGFSHARTTIPKWMQRGFMDPLDKVLAVLVLRIIALAREEPKHESKKPGH